MLRLVTVPDSVVSVEPALEGHPKMDAEPEDSLEESVEMVVGETEVPPACPQLSLIPAFLTPNLMHPRSQESPAESPVGQVEGRGQREGL